MSIKFEVSKVYKFDLYPAPILGASHSNMRVTTICDYNVAKLFSDVQAIHETIKQYVPNIPDDPSEYSYIIFDNPQRQNSASSSGYIVYGLPWIKSETIEEIGSNIMKVTIYNTTSTDIDLIKTALSQNGFGKISVEMQNI